MQQDLALKPWTAFQKFLFRFVFSYVLLFINSFSFPHSIIPDIGKYTSPYFEIPVKWFADTFLKEGGAYTVELISDSTGMYIHAAVLIFISAIICLVWGLADRKRENYQKLFYWFTVIVRYYLAMQLLTYGYSKIFKWQFYLPEPNILYTSVRDTPRDLLYWITMGSSRPYTLFMGLVEIAAACLLFFRKTFLLGALISAGILMNVVMVNFCFDISVKLYSCFLFLLAAILIVPALKKLFFFFIANKTEYSTAYAPVYSFKKQRLVYLLCKTFVICFMVTDALWMYAAANNFNDDAAARPLFNGAYEVTVFIRNKDTLAPLTTDSLRWKRVFIHRRGYFITQNMKDETQDYKLEYDTANHFLLIEEYNDKIKRFLKYELFNGNLFTLRGKRGNDSLEIRLKKIDMQNLPLLKNEFNLTIDE